MTGSVDRSYRALFAVPTIRRILLAMQIARIAQSMVGVAIVLFALEHYGSPAFAGLVTFVSIFPGLLLSPVAGALLDRHGRLRLVTLDYAVALAAMVSIGVLALADALPGPLLIGIAVVGSLTSILSHVGLRSLFPILVPEPLWERVNAVDSNGYVAATIIGPPLAAGMVALFGGPVALVVIGLGFGVAAVALLGVPDPATPIVSSGRVLADAWAGMRYTWRNRTLRGLGFSVALANLAHGMTTIVLPLIILERFGLSEAVVGLAFAVSGITGMISAFSFGRIDTRGREWTMLVIPSIILVPTVGLLLVAAGQPALPIGLGLVMLEMAVVGILLGPMDIALFTVRQRRTDSAWMGRAFAVSMAFNYVGMPIGAALAGVLAASSIEAAIVVLGLGGALAGMVATVTLVPRAGSIIPNREAELA